MANKLELTWVGKNEPINIEPRILIENPALSNDSADKKTENMLIHGDNLLALKALESKYSGQIKCIYIDPPYNTGSAFEHYVDGLEHSIWLNLMCERLKIMRKLLSNDGTIWITLDDNEVHYLKIVCDEIWGRSNFIADVIWNSRKSVSNDAILSLNTNHILVYASNLDVVRQMSKRSEMFKGPIDESKFDNPDNDVRGKWVADPFDAPNIRPNLTYPITNPNTGEVYMPPNGRCWRTTPEKYEDALRDGRIVFGKTGKTKPQMKRFLSECSEKGSVLTTLWDDLGTTTNATKHSQQLFNSSFTNPKPEDLIERVLQLATNENDIVLDSFLGSGTTAAVAHKMHRRYIGVEMGQQSYDYCKVRLDKVIANEDKGGITKSVDWQGGGAYKFYELAPTLIVEDSFGQSVINKEYNADMLASAVALHEGYTYAPDKECYFKQASNENNSFLYVTTRHVNREVIDSIKTQLKEDEYLVITCKSFDSNATEGVKNIFVKKIPQSLLENCTFGVDNYNLNIVNPPVYEDEEEE